MKKSDLEIMLREAGLLARERDFFLIGSQALRAVSPRIPRDFPKTLEADLYPRRHPQAWAILQKNMGRGSEFYRRHGCFLDCADPALSTIPDGWMERLIPFRTPRTGGVTAWCLEPHDLFVAKLVAWRDKDQLFLKAMLRHKFAKPALIEERLAELPVRESRKSELAALLDGLVKDQRRRKMKR